MSAVHKPNPTHYSHDDITLKPLVLPPTRRKSSGAGAGYCSSSRKAPHGAYGLGKGIPAINERREDSMRGMIAIVAITICCLADPLAPLTNLTSVHAPPERQSLTKASYDHRMTK
jgi:hypothetical protein